MHLALLSLLSEGPRHGYQLMKDLEERSGGMYRASAGAIYPTLQQLEDEDLAKVSEQEGKRVYRITEAGKKEVEANKEAIARIWERAKNLRAMAGPEHLNVFKPAMHVAMAAISAATRGGGEPDKIKKIREILEKAQQELDKLEK
ncbi:MAG TPA: PadR family transcriptional regulator [Candidatus Acidoferrales bacterium]|nr:PadR family transcriptional regulator [Candidatus Acidoferrales bacterium]